MYKLAMKTLPVDKIPAIISSQANQLDCSLSIKEASLALSTQASAGRQVIFITGHPGSGKSTYTQALLQEVINSGVVKDSEVLYFEFGQHESVNSVWNSTIDIAKTTGDRRSVAVLASNATTQEAKLKTTISIVNNFKITCFDYLSAANKELYALLLTLIKGLNSNVICISNLKTLSHMNIDVNVCIKVNGLCSKIGENVAEESIKIAVDNKGFKRSCKHLSYNPKAIQLYVNLCKEFGIHEIPELTKDEAPVSYLLEKVWDMLSDSEKNALYQFSELRQPLPLKSEAITLARILRIGLGSEKTISGDITYRLVSMSNAVRDFVQVKSSVVAHLKADEKFSILDCWTALLSEELRGLVKDARNNSWPFIPEKWQYVTDAGEKERYNVKDLITLKSQDLPHLTQFDILQECLHHSIVRKDYESMAAIIFVLDRFIYWQGGSKMLLSIVDSIAQGNPQVPIAPQLVIRKVRILTTSGDLQGAERALDKLLSEKEMVGVWRYKEKHDHHLVRAVCIQIKGEIQASLGHWVSAASLLLDSINGFKSLPKVDKKGLSCSLGLLGNALQNMSIEEFQDVAGRYSLTSPHPYHQAYTFAREAAEMAAYTPLFFARHKHRAGEMMLEFSKLFPSPRQLELLKQCLEELKESLKAHKSIESLKSREQYYEFIGALYKTSCVFEYQNDQQKIAKDLRRVSILLYDHYCRHQASVVHDAFSQRLINAALFILGLPMFGEDSSEFVPTSSQGDMIVPAKATAEHASTRPANDDTVDRCEETLRDTVVLSEYRTVDRLKTTVETVDEKDRSLPDGERNNDSIKQLNVADIFSDVYGKETTDLTATGVHECEMSRYVPVHSSWRTQKTLVYIGEQLSLAEGKLGAQRDPFMVEYLNQDQPLGKYVGKKYKKALGAEQYEEDVRCQMTARYYVGLFNQELYRKGVEISQIQFLPVVMLRLLNGHSDGQNTPVIYNVEPYIHGNFTKITNNWDFVNEKGEGSKLTLAFSHFTYEISNKDLVIVDHQGWTSCDHLSTTFLTDPQIHSVDKKHFGTGNLGTRGIGKFWEVMHTECNEICLQLGLRRPDGR